MKRAAMIGMVLWPVATAGCGYRPTHFANRAPVEVVHDDHPTAVPHPHAFFEELYEADVYVRRELVEGMDLRRSPRALDVNALDEVPRSSWYAPPDDAHHPLAGCLRDGPPKPPWHKIAAPAQSGMEDVSVVRDARGLLYELQAELPGRPGMRSSAAIIASRLACAAGYRTAEVHLVRNATGKRLAATRWPLGIDLGPTPIGEPRSDDPNDRLPHLERRSLRSLTMLTGWLAMKRLHPRVVRDVYVGPAGRGHVEHFLVGLDGALGVDDYLDALAWVKDRDRQDPNFFLRVVSLGLSPKPAAYPPETVSSSIGLLSERVLDAHLDPSPPFEPRDRMLPADAYWLAKRLAAIPSAAIADALGAAELGPIETNWLFQVLGLRRAQVVALGLSGTTPLEVVTIEPGRRRGTAILVLADLAVRTTTARAHSLHYRVSYLDADGGEISPEVTLPAHGALLRLVLPAALQRSHYVVVQVRGVRVTGEAPRAFEVHLRPGGGSYRLAGVQH